MASRINVPKLVELAVQDDDLFISDLENPEHPVNIKGTSGKRAGMGVMIGDFIYVSTGSTPTAPWVALKEEVALDRTRASYAAMTITQRDVNNPDPYNITVAAHPSGTDTLDPIVGVQPVSNGPIGGYYRVQELVTDGTSKEITVDDGKLVIPNDGVFLVPEGYANFRHSANNATVGLLFGIERAGQIFFSPRVVSSRQPNGGDIANISGGGKLTAQAGDKLSLWVASDTAGTINIGNSNIMMHMLEDTTVL